jgi:hypothetical protein
MLAIGASCLLRPLVAPTHPKVSPTPSSNSFSFGFEYLVQIRQAAFDQLVLVGRGKRGPGKLVPGAASLLIAGKAAAQSRQW